MAEEPAYDPRLPPGRQGLAREYVQAHQRERLINAMVAAVDANGYVETSVSDVLGMARVSRTTFYENFRDKEDCFLACYDQGTTLVLAAAAAALTPGGPWPQRVRRAFEAVLTTFADQPQLARVCMVEALAAGPAAQARYRGAIADLTTIIEDDVAAHEEAVPVSHLLVQGLVGGVAWIIYQEIVEGNTTELPQLLDELLRFFMAVFLGHQRAATIQAAGIGD